MAPPLTRGSTPEMAKVGPSFRGSPAHAGIDPWRVPSCAVPSWLPRSRGDRPHTDYRSPMRSKAPPLTRGSTLSISPPPLTETGSPAHAGIDPSIGWTDPRSAGLPRSRGDRPYYQQGSPGQVAAPPLTRGSTRGRLHCENGPAGSPAHAGIDPGNHLWAAQADRLPRSRGDRPFPGALVSEDGGAPPLTRGSTLSGKCLLICFIGSPAHAGIDPMSATNVVPIRRLPRSRGDRPPEGLDWLFDARAPPLTRGSTRSPGGASDC